MPDARQRIEGDIITAQQLLENALFDLNRISGTDLQNLAYGTHALNNLLTVTSTFVELMQLQLSPPADSELSTFFAATRHSLEIMAYMVDYIIQGQTHRTIALRIEPTDVRRTMQRACAYYQSIASCKALTMIPRYSGEVPPVRGDRVVVAMILDNYLSNAIKYSPPGRRIYADIDRDRQAVVCSIADEGPGLSREDQAKLFQRDMRLTPRPTAGEASHGFGLALVKDLANQVGATVGCDSELGHGTRFWVRLPIHVPEEPPSTVLAVIPAAMAYYFTDLAAYLVG
jgi:signal transduction histidine kinase